MCVARGGTVGERAYKFGERAYKKRRSKTGSSPHVQRVFSATGQLLPTFAQSQGPRSILLALACASPDPCFSCVIPASHVDSDDALHSYHALHLVVKCFFFNGRCRYTFRFSFCRLQLNITDAEMVFWRGHGTRAINYDMDHNVPRGFNLGTRCSQCLHCLMPSVAVACNGMPQG